MPHLFDPFLLPLRGRVLDCRPGRAHVMGILNVTPDSFSDGGRYTGLDAALRRVEAMLEEGAVLIDVGGESSRPKGKVYGRGADVVDAKEELRRVLPVVEGVLRRFPEAAISVDTYKAEVADAVLAAGACMINDITGLRFDADMAAVVARHNAPLVVMHSLGTPGAMPHEAASADIVETVWASLQVSLDRAEAAGVPYLVTDPGFGFGKTVSENLRLMAHIPAFVSLNRPVLVGISRKSTIGAVLGSAEAPVPVGERLYGTLGATAAAVLGGASLVRTHDVRETVELLRGLEAVVQAANPEAS